MACFLCDRTEVKEKRNDRLECSYYECQNCGKYVVGKYINEKDLSSANMGGNSFEEFRNKAACIATEKKLKGMDNFFLLTDSEEKVWKGDSLGSYTPIGITNFLKEYPQDAIEMFDRILLTLGRLIKHPADSYTVSTLFKPHNAIFYSTSDEQAKSMIEELKNLDWIKASRSKNSELFTDLKITPNGWQHLAELREARAFEHSDKVFLAMWFNKETNNLRDAVRKAVELAGYYPEEITVDDAEHNDFIMDKVMNMITEARFVIADFTCAPEDEIDNGKIPGGVRGGVYFEAGFARGQGKEVIHTCKKGAESRLHFDVHQINTIFWKEEDGILTSYGNDFIDLLKNRIIATVGKGKHQ